MRNYSKKAEYSHILSKEILNKLSNYLNNSFNIKLSQKVYNAILYQVINTIVENVIHRIDYKIKYNNKTCKFFLPRNLVDFHSQLENKNLDRLIEKKFFQKREIFNIFKDFQFLKIFIKNLLFRKKRFTRYSNIIATQKKNIISDNVEFFKLEYRHYNEIKKIISFKKNWKISNLKKINLIHGKVNEKFRTDFYKQFKNKDKEKRYILGLIIDLIPSQYFEMFYENFKSVSFSYQILPRIIVSNAHNWYSNDQFKFFLGYSLANNSKYIDVQINGSHFLTKYSPHYNVSKNFIDGFISWGYKSKNKKIINLPCLYNCLLKKNKNKNKKNPNKILYVGASIADHFKGYWGSYLDGGKVLEYQNFRNIFFENLHLGVKRNFILRMRDTNKISIKSSSKFLKKNYLTDVVEKIDTSLSERIVKNDLKFLVVDHISTPFLEIANSNIPFILILNPKFNFFNKKYNYLIRLMIKEKILFYNPKKAATYLNKINFYKISSSWAKDKEKQRIRHELMKHFYKKNKNWIKNWRSSIEKFN